MKKMEKEEMVEFLKGMKRWQQILNEEKDQLKGSVETLEEAIHRNTFSRKADDSGIRAPGFSPDKVLHILLNSQRDILEEMRSMVNRLRRIYETEDQIDFVRCCLLQIPPREQQVIRGIYFNGILIDSLAKSMDLSRSYLYKLLQKALDDLLAVYNSRCEAEPYEKADRLVREAMQYMPEGSIA